MMHNRRTSSQPGLLPLVEGEKLLPPRPGSVRRRTKRGGGRGSDVLGVVRLLLGMVALGVGVVVIQRLVVQHRPSSMDSTARSHPLDAFVSLRLPLANSQLVGLYFAASWCPASNQVSELLDEDFNDILLAPSLETSVQRQGLSIVYISSDNDEAAYDGYLEGRPWWSVPFESEDRTALKKHFSTCAKPEIELLGIDRKHEIPTLIVVEAASQRVLTFTGVEDVRQAGPKAIDEWFELARISTALDAKFHHSSESADEGNDKESDGKDE